MASATFYGKLAEFLDFGHVLEITAKAECNASWFGISLATANSNESETSDIGIRILVNINQESIKFKQQIKQKWIEVDEEEFETKIFRGQAFTVTILMEEKKFHICINRERLGLVKYAFEVQKLNTVQIVGDLTSIRQVDHRKYFPLAWPPIQHRDDRLDFSHDIPLSFQPGHVMVITMKLLGKMSGGRFQMDFRNVWNCKCSEVHISVRFDNKTIVRNSKIPLKDGKLGYGKEEISKGTFPFDFVSKTFKMAVAFTANTLRFAKDGGFLFNYNFRTPNVLSDLSGVKIMGINGMTTRVSAIEHFQMQDPYCEGFERYSDA